MDTTGVVSPMHRTTVVVSDAIINAEGSVSAVIAFCILPASTIHWPNAGLMLGRRLRLFHYSSDTYAGDISVWRIDTFQVQHELDACLVQDKIGWSLRFCDSGVSKLFSSVRIMVLNHDDPLSKYNRIYC